jgi:hypothetical protein
VRAVVGLACVLVGGCHVFFDLHDPDVRPDAMTDAAVDAVSDAAGDADVAPGCWTNGQQDTDEDGDLRVDGCDNCPGVANAEQEDGDEDGVGNPCDPRPGQMDRIVHFDGFGADNMSLLTVGGIWIQTGGVLHQTQAVDARATLGGLNIAGAAAATELVYIAGNAAPEVPASGVYVSGAMLDDPTLASAIACFETREEAPPNRAVLRHTVAGLETESDADAAGTESMYVRVTSMNEDNRPACRAKRRGRNADELVIATSGPLSGEIGLFTRAGPGSFHFLTVIEPR